MREQIIELSGHSKVVVETPCGLVILEWTGKAKKWKATIPDSLTAHRTVERAIENAKFLTQDADGRIRPKFHVLEPKLGEHGELVGVQAPPVFRLVSTAG